MTAAGLSLSWIRVPSTAFQFGVLRNRETLESVRTSRGKVHTGSTCMPHGPQCGICGTLNIVEHCAIHTVEHCATLWHIVAFVPRVEYVEQCCTMCHKVAQCSIKIHTLSRHLTSLPSIS